MSYKTQLNENNTQLEQITEIASNLPVAENLQAPLAEQDDLIDQVSYELQQRTALNPEDYATKEYAEYLAEEATAAANEAIEVANSKAPAYTYGTEDLVAGTSELPTGTLYFVYE